VLPQYPPPDSCAALAERVTRPFSFAGCLHTPPMLAHYFSESEAQT
jgi:hypothetical protein